MFGLEYHRRRAHLKPIEVAKTADVNYETIIRLEKHLPLSTPCDTIYALASALKVPMEEIIREYPADALSAGDHPPTKSRTENPANCLSRYRQEKNLTFQELAKRLGNHTRESGRLACARETPRKKHVQKLAEFEGISMESFHQIYGEK